MARWLYFEILTSSLIFRHIKTNLTLAYKTLAPDLYQGEMDCGRCILLVDHNCAIWLSFGGNPIMSEYWFINYKIAVQSWVNW